jgi:uncharacterized protein with PhoU and TrkA domain
MAQKLALSGIHHLFNISETLKIVDMNIPRSLAGERFLPVAFREHTHLKVIALKREDKILYSSSKPISDQDIEEIIYKRDDILVLSGELKDIRKFCKS